MTDLPDRWTSSTVGSLCEKVDKIDPVDLGRSEFLYVDIGSITPGQLWDSEPSVIAVGDAPTRARQLLEAGDTLFSTVRPYLLKIVGVSDDLHGEIASTGFCVLRPRESVLVPRLLTYYCVSDHALNQILPLQRGVSYPAVRDKEVAATLMPLPPREEQDEIVRILDTQLARLDTVLEAVQAVRDRADQLRRSLLHAAFTGQLTQPDPARRGSLPDGWSVATLGEVARWGSGGTPKAGNSAYYGGDVPWAVIGDLNDGVVSSTKASISAEGLENSSAKLIGSGTLLVAMYGSIGKLGVAGVPMSTNQAIAFAVPHTNMTTTPWLFRYIESQRPALARSGKGATQQNISQTILKSWPVPLPALSEQAEIVRILDTQLARLDSALSAADEAEEECGRLRRSLLQAAFTGELTKTWREANG